MDISELEKKINDRIAEGYDIHSKNISLFIAEKLRENGHSFEKADKFLSESFKLLHRTKLNDGVLSEIKAQLEIDIQREHRHSYYKFDHKKLKNKLEEYYKINGNDLDIIMLNKVINDKSILMFDKPEHIARIIGKESQDENYKKERLSEIISKLKDNSIEVPIGKFMSNELTRINKEGLNNYEKNVISASSLVNDYNQSAAEILVNVRNIKGDLGKIKYIRDTLNEVREIEPHRAEDIIHFLKKEINNKSKRGRASDSESMIYEVISFDKGSNKIRKDHALRVNQRYVEMAVSDILNKKESSIELKAMALVDLARSDSNGETQSFIQNELMKNGGEKNKLNWVLSEEISSLRNGEYRANSKGIQELIISEKTENILNDLSLSSQEKTRELIEIVKNSPDPTFGEYVMHGKLLGYENFELGRLLSNQIQAASTIGFNNYKTNSVDFLNYNNDPNEVAHAIHSKGLENKEHGENVMFEKMREFSSLIVSTELRKDALEIVKEKFSSNYNNLSNKINELIEDFSKSKIGNRMANFMKGFMKNDTLEKQEKKIETPKFK